LANDGTVYATGENNFGQLGVGSTNEVTSFTKAVESSGTPLSNVTAIATGYKFSLALKADGSLWATGWNNYGQLGTGDEKDRSSFTKVATGVKDMTAGRLHSIITKNDGTTLLSGTVNPFACLNGSGTILIKVNDTYQYQYIKNMILYDRNSTEILNAGAQVATGGSGYKMSVKPGTYKVSIFTSNLTAEYIFSDLVVTENETITILYEWVSFGIGYRFTVTHSK
jgi:alpha-tubulin suppressor-like RCC1 family protein